MRNSRIAVYALWISVIVAVVFSWKHRWHGEDGNGWEALVDGDSKGYYAFLPAWFIFHDPSMSFFVNSGNQQIQRYYNPRFRVATPQGTVNKNYSGVAVVLAPFFLAGHLVAGFAGYPQTGYSQPYFFMLLAGSISFFALGLFYMVKLLRTYQLPESSIALIVLMTGIGTNLLYYASIHAAMSHVYSFAFVAMFAYTFRSFVAMKNKKYLFASACLLGVIFLLRPVNLMVVLAIPLLVGSWGGLKGLFRDVAGHFGNWAAAAMLFAGICGIQALVFHWQTGHFWVWSYGEEGFLWSHPRMFGVLFSFRKGLFVYTPVLLLLVPGLVLLFKRNRFQSGTFLLFFASVLYVIASWWNWYYGDGYGMRAFIDFYPLLFIPVAYVPASVNRVVMWILLLMLLGWSLLQNYQYRYQVIHPSAMNFKKYRWTLFKTSPEFRDQLGGDEQDFYGTLSEMPVLEEIQDYENPGIAHTQRADDGHGRVLQLGANEEFGTGIEAQGSVFKDPASNLYARIGLDWKELSPKACTNAFLVCVIRDSLDREYSYQAFRIADVPDNPLDTWQHTQFGFMVPRVQDAHDRFILYLWNKGKGTFQADHLRLSVHPVVSY